MNKTKIQTGIMGQRLAEKYYRKLGHNIICTNLKSRAGEIDLVTSFYNKLHLIEIKASNSHETYSYQTWIKKQKFRLLKTFYANQQLFYHYPTQEISIEFIKFDLSTLPTVRLTRFCNLELDYG